MTKIPVMHPLYLATYAYAPCNSSETTHPVGFIQGRTETLT